MCSRAITDKFKVVALGAHKERGEARQQVLDAALSRSTPRSRMHRRRAISAERLAGSGVTTRVLGGAEGLIEIASMPEAGVVMAGIAGSAGLRSTLAAAQAGKRVLLANKESLVMAGPLVIAAVRAAGATLCQSTASTARYFQCLPPSSAAGKVCAQECGASC
jgi:1-deoxy-D-xylulose-5-phosphate reductoisomerase